MGIAIIRLGFLADGLRQICLRRRRQAAWRDDLEIE